MFESCRTGHVWRFQRWFFIGSPQASLGMTGDFQMECISDLSFLGRKVLLVFPLIPDVFFLFRETPKRTRVARATIQILAQCGITKNTLRDVWDYAASSAEFWYQHYRCGQITRWLYKPQIPLLSVGVSKNELHVGCNVVDWGSSFF